MRIKNKPKKHTMVIIAYSYILEGMEYIDHYTARLTPVNNSLARKRQILPRVKEDLCKRLAKEFGEKVDFILLSIITI